MKKYIKLVVVLCAVQFFYNYSFSCSCLESQKLSKSEYDNSLVVFKGEVIGIEEEFSVRTNSIRLIVVESYKNCYIGDTIVINSNPDTGLCGLKIRKGQLWYMFILTKHEGEYWEDICGRSLNITKVKRKWFDEHSNYSWKVSRRNRRKARKELNLIKLWMKNEEAE